MHKAFVSLLGLGLVTLLSSTAAAAGRYDFGRQGQLIFSADRLFGVYGGNHSVKYTSDNRQEIEVTHSGTTIGFILSPHSPKDYPGSSGLFTLPRLSFDYLVTNGLTIGGSVGIAHWSGQTETKPGTTVDDASLMGILFSPRIGYAYMFSDVVGIWPRGGLTYASMKTVTHANYDISGHKGTQTDTRNIFALNLEAMLVLSPADHFAFVVGPILDWGFTGSGKYENHDDVDGRSYTGPDLKARAINYGCTAGLLGYF